MPQDYCEEIANIIEQYRLRNRKKGCLNVEFDKSHVERWVSQFDNHHEIILQETFKLLNEYYFSKENIEEYLTGIYSSTKIWGKDIEQAISNTIFLNCQTKGNSQDRLYKKSRKIILDLYGIDIEDCDSDATSFVYVDDCMFSGNTVRKDMEKLIRKVPNGSTINTIFMVVHSFAEWWIQQSLKDSIKENNINFDIWRCKTIQNSGGRNHSYECLWPQEYESENVSDYINTLKDESDMTPGKKVRLFRESIYSGGVYTSEDSRAILEQELMEAGLKIISFSDNNKRFIRPMGYDNRISFGFGAFFATYMNMSNNCPLAFWWGDANAEPWHPFSKWYPLLPRKANENGGDMFVWE
ncbi:hypothetical protein [Oscillibacter sp.]|uniref:phosphoribosyltransferase-like protein n=1 Tax=Oscillibacter sp. TaxID=1945593 RepID=UPI00289C7422|nr:hypothetical protein [Oscillibacter sp.]